MYINSIAHGILIFTSSYTFMSQKMSIDEYLAYIEMTKGYLFQDLILLIYFHKVIDGFVLMLFHHIIFFTVLYSEFVGIYPYLLAKALTCEITNFFLYGGWFLIQLGLQDTFIFVMNGIILVTLFFYFRVYNFLSLFIFALEVPEAYFPSITLLIVSLLNVYWFVLLLEKLMKILVNL